MITTRLYGILIFATIFLGCGQSTSNEFQSRKNVKEAELEVFPYEIKNSKTDRHIRVEGTKMYVIIPEDYKYIKELARYQKNDKLYIQFFESFGSSFIEMRPMFTKESIEAKGARVDFMQDVKLGNLDAIFSIGPSKYPGETKVGLVFGDHTFASMISGVFKSDDLKGKDELIEVIKSIIYDQNHELNPIELANFEFDQSITNFKYAMTTSNFFVFSENGKEDIDNHTSNAIQIATMPKMTKAKAIEFNKDLFWRYERNGVFLYSEKLIELSINSYSTFVLETKIDQENKHGVLYQVTILGKNSSVVFIGTAFNNTDEYLLKFKNTVKSIKIK